MSHVVCDGKLLIAVVNASYKVKANLRAFEKYTHASVSEINEQNLFSFFNRTVNTLTDW